MNHGDTRGRHNIAIQESFPRQLRRKNKTRLGKVNVLQYALGPLSGQVTGSVKVAIPNSCDRGAFCEEHKQEEMRMWAR